MDDVQAAPFTLCRGMCFFRINYPYSRSQQEHVQVKRLVGQAGSSASNSARQSRSPTKTRPPDDPASLAAASTLSKSTSTISDKAFLLLDQVGTVSKVTVH